MKRIALPVVALIALSACDGVNSQNADETVAGAALGAGVGAIAGDDQNIERNVAIGAAVGGAIGAAAGVANTCTYRNTRTGEVFTAECGTY